MNKIIQKKYFGEIPLEGPTKLSSLYKDMAKAKSNSRPHDERLDRFLKSYLSATQLAEYGDLSKESADRIIAILNKEQEHRHQKELNLMNAHTLTNRIRLVCAFLFSIIVIAAAIVLSFFKAYYVALAAIAFGIFIYIFIFKPRFSQKHHHNRPRHFGNRHNHSHK